MKSLKCRTVEYCMLKARLLPVIAICIIVTTMMSGCKGTDVYFSDGLRSSELMKIDGHIVYMDEARLLLAESKHSYESAFNGNIWNEQIFNTTMEDYVKSDIKDKLQKLEYYDLMADGMGIELDEDEENRAGVAADRFMESLKDGVADSLDISRNTVLRLYKSIALAEKTFYSATSSVDVEVSVDEARVIKVQYVFVKTSDINEDGSIRNYNDEEKDVALTKINSIKQQLDANTNFMSLAANQSDDEQYELELGRGDYDKDFERASFELDTGEVSDIVETQYGYYIIRCVDDSLEGMYEDQCSKIVLARRKAMFNSYYNKVVSDSPVEINTRKWNSLSIEDLPVSNGDFFNIYNEQFDNYYN